MNEQFKLSMGDLAASVIGGERGRLARTIEVGRYEAEPSPPKKYSIPLFTPCCYSYLQVGQVKRQSTVLRVYRVTEKISNVKEGIFATVVNVDRRLP